MTVDFMASYVLSTKKRKMLVLATRLFYYNKTKEIVDDFGRRCVKTYWKCSTKGCAGSACTVVDEDGREVEVKVLREHDTDICQADETKVLRRDKRNQVRRSSFFIC